MHTSVLVENGSSPSGRTTNLSFFKTLRELAGHRYKYIYTSAYVRDCTGTEERRSNQSSFEVHGTTSVQHPSPAASPLCTAQRPSCVLLPSQALQLSIQFFLRQLLSSCHYGNVLLRAESVPLPFTRSFVLTNSLCLPFSFASQRSACTGPNPSCSHFVLGICCGSQHGSRGSRGLATSVVLAASFSNPAPRSGYVSTQPSRTLRRVEKFEIAGSRCRLYPLWIRR